MTLKKSDRIKYNPDGKNEYSQPKEKPPRYDLRRKHKVNSDPLDQADRKLEEKLSTEVEVDTEKEIAKKVARAKIAARPTKSEAGYNLQREGLENYKIKDSGVRAIAKSYKYLADAFLNMTKSLNTFTSCKSSEISPDGKLGGKGYIMPIRDIRGQMAECLNNMSELLDTFHDEVNSPYWKKTTVEDNPIVKEILDKADEILEEAEAVDDEQKEATSSALSESEKQKVLTILKNKGHI